MSDENKNEVGSVSWIDLTIGQAEEIRDFYSKVVGWKSEPVSMGDYSDYSMIVPESGKPAAGICHARGTNEGLPAKWLIYITVENLEESIRQCNESGGKVVFGPKPLGNYGSFCVIEDPAGAVAGLIEPKR